MCEGTPRPLGSSQDEAGDTKAGATPGVVWSAVRRFATFHAPRQVVRCGLSSPLFLRLFLPLKPFSAGHCSNSTPLRGGMECPLDRVGTFHVEKWNAKWKTKWNAARPKWKTKWNAARPEWKTKWNARPTVEITEKHAQHPIPGTLGLAPRAGAG